MKTEYIEIIITQMHLPPTTTAGVKVDDSGEVENGKIPHFFFFFSILAPSRSLFESQNLALTNHDALTEKPFLSSGETTRISMMMMMMK